MPSKGAIWVEGDCVASVQFMHGDGCLAVEGGDGNTCDYWRRKKGSLFWTKDKLSSRRMRTFSANEEVA